MNRCDQISEELQSVQSKQENLVDLLNDYRQNPSKYKQKELKQVVETLQENVDEFEEGLRQEVQNLLSSHPHAEEFEGKLLFENGEVVITDRLNFSNQTEIYLPSIIDKIEGHLSLRYLESAKDLTLPDTIGKSINLESLESAEGLELHENIERYIYLDSLSEKEREQLRDEYPNLANQITTLGL